MSRTFDMTGSREQAIVTSLVFRGSIGLIISAVPIPLTAQEPVFLSARQFVDARFASSVPVMKPIVRNQLAGTYPNARSDQGPIDWQTTDYRIEHFGEPSMLFRNMTWNREGGNAPPTLTSVAAEAYFNCGLQPSTRSFLNADVRTTEAEQSRTQSRQVTNRVTATVSISYSGTGGLGGEASKVWERIVQNSEEFTSKTRETVQSTTEVRQEVTIPPLALRFFSYSTQLEKEEYVVEAAAIIDIPVVAIYTRPRMITKETIMVPTLPNLNRLQKVQIERVNPPKDFRFDIGNWSYYYPVAPRTIPVRANVTISRETTFSGPIEVQFSTVQECLVARQALEQRQTDVASLVSAAQALVRQ